MTAETVLREENAIISQSERYKGPNASYSAQFTPHKRTGQENSKEYGKSKNEYRVNSFSGRRKYSGKEPICFACGEHGHVARTQKTKQPVNEGWKLEMSGIGRAVRSQPQTASPTK
jgi:hypothetical protein